MDSNINNDTNIEKTREVLMGLLKELDRVCKKHSIAYFVGYGTLLGAVRHKGFIPWDDDIDVMMFREDYNKLLKIGSDEFKDPYYFQNTYTDPFMIWGFSKLRDSRTTAIEFKDAPPSLNQGIFLDIFPLDSVPDGEEYPENIYYMSKEVWTTIVSPDEMKLKLDEGKKFNMASEVLYGLINMEPNIRFQVYEEFVSSNHMFSKRVNFLTDEFYNVTESKQLSWFDGILYVPFEDMMVPVPIGYDEFLKSQYGENYMTPLQIPNDHDRIFIDPFKSYTEYI